MVSANAKPLVTGQLCCQKSSANVTEVNLADSFLSKVKYTDNTKKPWSAYFFVPLNDNHEVKHDFILETRPDVSVRSNLGWHSSQTNQSDRHFGGPGNIALPVLGKVNTRLHVVNRYINKILYIVQNQQTNL